MEEENVAWEFDSIGANDLIMEKPPSGLSLFGPFFSNYDPSEGPVGSGKEIAEAVANEKRQRYPDGPIPGKIEPYLKSRGRKSP